MKIENLFGKSKYSILKLIYEKKRAYVREIIRETKLNENTVVRFLEQFKKMSILIKEKEGSNNYYKFDSENRINRKILEMFDSEKFESLPFERKETINLFLSSLYKKPLFVILFGSTAKGNFIKKSDIDLFLCFNSYTGSDIKNLMANSKKVEAKTNINIHFEIIDYINFKKQDKDNYSLQNIIKTGFPVLGAEYFYEVILNEKN